MPHDPVTIQRDVAITILAVRQQRAVAILLGSAWVMRAGWRRSRSFAQLRADVAAVPVPPGVTFVRESETINDGPGFTSKKLAQVTRNYRNSLGCEELVRAWTAALRDAQRRFEVWDSPHMHEATGGFGISIRDRPEHIGIYLGSISYEGGRECATPFISAYASLRRRDSTGPRSGDAGLC